MVQRKKKYHVSIFSPSPLICAGLENILVKEKDFTIREVANNYSEARKLITNPNCDIIVAGLCPGFWGNTNLVKYNRNQNPSLPLLVCSDWDNPYYVASCLEEGANGYVLTTEPEKKIRKAVRDVLRNQEYVSEGIIRINPEEFERVKSLTWTESQVLKLRSQGFSRETISALLNIPSYRTVDTHIRNIKNALGFRNPEDFHKFAVQYAIWQDRLQR